MKPYIVAMSHLSDAQELMRMGRIEDANREVNFAKWVMSKYREDMVSEFDSDNEWYEFSKKF